MLRGYILGKVKLLVIINRVNILKTNVNNFIKIFTLYKWKKKIFFFITSELYPYHKVGGWEYVLKIG
jgi:hypothetical protein